MSESEDDLFEKSFGKVQESSEEEPEEEPREEPKKKKTNGP